MSDKAIAAARAVHYVGAGTVEFIFDNDTQKFYFMEMFVLKGSTCNVAERVVLGIRDYRWNTPSLK